MCKLAIVTHSIPSKYAPNVRAAIKEMGERDRDGLGVSCFDRGEIRFRRWAAPSHFHGFTAPSIDAPWVDATSTPALPSGRWTGSSVFHTRFATSAKGLGNCHPMHVPFGDSHLVLSHNGIVESEKKFPTRTGCDSELLALALAEGNGGMDSIVQNITGYYAFGALLPDGSCVVVRDSSASLLCSVAPWGGFVFATTKEILNEFGCRGAAEVTPNTYLRFKPLAGGKIDLMAHERFTPKERKWVSPMADKALGANWRTPALDAWDAHKGKYAARAERKARKGQKALSMSGGLKFESGISDPDDANESILNQLRSEERAAALAESAQGL